MPGSSSEVLVTSSDSRIRVVDGTDLVTKLKGKTKTNKVSSFGLLFTSFASKSNQSFFSLFDRVSKHEQPNLRLNNSRRQIRSVSERGFKRLHMEVRIPCFSTKQEQQQQQQERHSHKLLRAFPQPRRLCSHLMARDGLNRVLGSHPRQSQQLRRSLHS